MQPHLSPKELALVIGVSESSLKRWVDDGRVEAIRTVGGHRRITIQEAVRFIRHNNHPVIRPDLLGLSDLTANVLSRVTQGAGGATLQRALMEGKGEEARGIILAEYLSCRSVATVCDGAITHSMHRMGELWRHREDGIGLEHQATNICVEAMHQIRVMLPPLPEQPLTAVGGSIETDPYMLPSLMASTCFREIGVQDVNLGPDVPVDSLLAAAARHKARFLWLSASSCVTPERIPEVIRRLAEGVQQIGACAIVGGRALRGMEMPESSSLHMVDSMAELVALAMSVRAERQARAPAAAG